MVITGEKIESCNKVGYLTMEQVEKYNATVRRTVEWAYNNQENLDKERDIQAHYKAPYLWAVTGDMKMAGRYRKLVRERFLQEDGDFRIAENVKGFQEFPCTVHNQYIYANGWLISGLQKLGAFEIVNKALEFILRFQDPEYGGFYYAFDAEKKKIDKSLMDSSSTSSAGMALLNCGHLPPARRGGDFILRLLELQPQPDRYFFSCMKPDGALHTDVFESEDQWDANSRKQKCLSTEGDGENELTWLIGKPTKFLTRLYTATGEKKYLDGAIQCFNFFHKLDKKAWQNFASCKTMWAGAELYRITGEKIFAETALRILDFYCETQSPSGSWVHTLWYGSESDQAFTWTSDITHEYGAEISDVIFDLCSR
jgi:hypothetical protein